MINKGAILERPYLFYFYSMQRGKIVHFVTSAKKAILPRYCKKKIFGGKSNSQKDIRSNNFLFVFI